MFSKILHALPNQWCNSVLIMGGGGESLFNIIDFGGDESCYIPTGQSLEGGTISPRNYAYVPNYLE